MRSIDVATVDFPSCGCMYVSVSLKLYEIAERCNDKPGDADAGKTGVAAGKLEQPDIV